MPKAVLFDCDGVLVDSEYMKFEAWRDALQLEHISLSLDEYKQVAGASSKIIAQSIMHNKKCNFNTAKVIDYKNALYKEANLGGAPPIHAAAKYLNELLAQKDALDLKVAVVSSDARENTLRNLKSAEINIHLLDGVFSGHDDLQHINDPEGTNKPKPYIYELTAQKLCVPAKHNIVFEDTNAGIVAAFLAGMVAIAVPNKFTEQQDFSKATLITTFDNFAIADLNQILNSII